MDKIIRFIRQESEEQVNNHQFQNNQQTQMIQGLNQLASLAQILYKIIMELIENIKIKNLQSFLTETQRNYEGIEYWNKLFEGIHQYIEVKDRIIKKLPEEIQLNERMENMISIIKQSDDSLQEIIKKLQSNLANSKKFSFQEEKKNVDIAVIDQCKLKKINSNSHAMAFADQGFDPSSESYAFSFKIQNQSSNVWVGVGNDKGLICSSSYFFYNCTELGHGQYMVSYHKFIFHHTDMLQNHNYTQGITFETGDKIQINYNHLTKQLTFKKNNQTLQYDVVKMTITDMTKKLYPCAYLFGIDDQVQLAEY